MHTVINRINDEIALFITSIVSTMWCAYLFAAIALTSLPSTLAEHSVQADVQWTAQTFLQLVLLSVIMVGQRVQSEKLDAHVESVQALHAKHDRLHEVITRLEARLARHQDHPEEYGE
jgi:cytochrome c biogenesis factor